VSEKSANLIVVRQVGARYHVSEMSSVIAMAKPEASVAQASDRNRNVKS
jgi:hypothetical protein